MLNTKELLRQTEEAKRRITREEQQKEERRRLEEEANQKALLQQEDVRRKEEEAQRLAEERLDTLAKQRRDRQLMAKRELSSIFSQVITEALRGHKELLVSVTQNISDVVEKELVKEGFCIKRGGFPMSLGGSLESRVKKVIDYVDDSLWKPKYQNRLGSGLKEAKEAKSPRSAASSILQALGDLEAEERNVLTDEGRIYLIEDFLPYLRSLMLDAVVVRYRVGWLNADMSRPVFTKRGHVPSWLSSSEGRSFMQEVGKWCAEDANEGRRKTLIKVSESENANEPHGTARWTWLERDQPVVWTTFSQEILFDIFRARGFKVRRVTKEEANRFEISW